MICCAVLLTSSFAAACTRKGSCWSKPIDTYHDLSSYFLRWRGFAHRLVKPNRLPRAWDYESPTRQEHKVLPFLKLQPLRIFYDCPFLNILSHCVVVVFAYSSSSQVCPTRCILLGDPTTPNTGRGNCLDKTTVSDGRQPR